MKKGKATSESFEHSLRRNENKKSDWNLESW